MEESMHSGLRPLGWQPEVVKRLRGLDGLWRRCVAEFGFSLRHDLDAWVSYDGEGRIHVAPTCDLDAEDSLAQILLHELCHFFVEGQEARFRMDWGLSNEDGSDVEREHAALALQRVLTSAHGLDEVLVPTTDFRSQWRALPGWEWRLERHLGDAWLVGDAGALGGLEGLSDFQIGVHEGVVRLHDHGGAEHLRRTLRATREAVFCGVPLSGRERICYCTAARAPAFSVVDAFRRDVSVV